MCVALAALEAKVQVAGPGWRAHDPFADFHRLPGDTPHIDNNLRPEEIITAIELPAAGFAGQLHLSENPRSPVLRLRACLGGGGAGARRRQIKEARVALGGVAHKPWRDPAAEAAAARTEARRQRSRQAADLLLRDAKGFAHNAFKIDLARRAIVRALTQAATERRKSNRARDSVTVMTSRISESATSPRRRACQGDGRRQIRRRVSTLPASGWGSVVACDDCQGTNQAHRQPRGARRRWA